MADRFVGRDDLFRRLAEFAGRPCGYFRVVADAGLGKTALAAAAARRQHAPAFFANAGRGLTRPDQCLNHLAVELIAHFGLDHDHLPARAGEDSAFLGKALAEAAAKAQAPLWIVVNALDEADPPGPGRNPLLLPDRLPRGVHVLLTHRPGQVALATDAATADEEYPIASSDATQQADIEAYLRREADRPEVRRAREAANPPIAADRFVAFLKDKSEGNFKYLEYVLADIAARQPGFDPLELEALPGGLREYYRKKFWEYMEAVSGREGPEEWDLFYRPVIAFLAAAREAVPAPWLAALVGRPAARIEQRALKPWRRFLSQEHRGRNDRSRPRRWRVVHQSFVDFLDEEDAVDIRAAHDAVATYYLSAWGGLDAGLPALFDTASPGGLDDYGLRHLAEHLERAGRIDDLHHLLRLERRVGGVETASARVENAWFAARERVGQIEGYMTDLARAARPARCADRPDIKPARDGRRIGAGIRYTLMSTSLNSMAQRIPPALIASLVKKGVWLPLQGLAYARVLPPATRVYALIEFDCYPEHLDSWMVRREALDAARAIGDDDARACALAFLGQAEEALALARAIGDDGAAPPPWRNWDIWKRRWPWRGRSATTAPRRRPGGTGAPPGRGRPGGGGAGPGAGDRRRRRPRRRPGGTGTSGRGAGRGLEDRVQKGPLPRPGRGCAPPGQGGPGGRGHQAGVGDQGRGVPSPRPRPGWAGHRPGRGRPGGAGPDGGADDRLRGGPRPHSGRAGPGGRGPGVGAADRVRRGPRLRPDRPGAPPRRGESSRAGAGGGPADRGRMGSHPRPGGAGSSGGGCLASARRAGLEGDRARRPAEPRRVEEALASARRITSDAARAHALAELSPDLTEPGHVEEALALARRIGDEWARASALASLGQVGEALEVARGIGPEGTRAQILAALAPRVAAMAQAEVLPLWRETLRFSAKRSRRDLLADLAALAPVIATLGGPEAIAETCRAIEDVGRWWP